MRKHAFTLAELLVVITIFSIIITVSSSMISVIMGQRQHYEAQLAVNQQTRNIIEPIARDIKVAFGGDVYDSIDVPDPKTLILRQSGADKKQYQSKNIGLNKEKIELTYTPYTETPGTASLAPADIVVIVDVTGSMAGTKIAALKTALINFLDILKNKEATIGPAGSYRIAIVSYSSPSGCSTNCSIGVTDQLGGFKDLSNYSTMITKINALIASGFTNMGAGMKKANEIMSSTRPARQAMSPVPREIGILMTDGEANQPSDALTNATWGVYPNEPLIPKLDAYYTIGFQVASAEPVLRKVARDTSTNGTDESKYISASDAAALDTAYANIANEIGSNTMFTEGTSRIGDVTSISEVNVNSITFAKSTDSNGWPYVTIDLIMDTGQPMGLPKYAKAKVHTVVSSRGYR